MLTLVAVLCAAAAPQKLVVTRFSAVGVESERAAYFAAQLGARLQSRGFNVITEKDLIAVLGIERQRQLMGCSDASCMVELTSALGADVLVSGSLVKLGDEIEATANVTDARNARLLASRRVTGDSEQAVLDGLGVAADQLAAELRSERPPLQAGRVTLWAPLFGGALAAGVASGVLFVMAGGAYRMLDGASATARLTAAQADAAVRDGKALQLGAWVAAGVAGAFAVAGLIALLWPAPYQVRLALAPNPGGGALALEALW